MKKLAICVILAIFCICDIARAGGMVRLHVIGETDWQTDQAYKLMVRDWALEACGAEDMEKELNDHAEEMGMPRNITVERGVFPYPASDEYPAGDYEAIRVRIGRAEGRNWWGMLYPDEAGYTEDAVYYSAIVDWLLSLFGIE
ncbi:MAG: stage II sporulation protein R [Clostridia bacterium]|nr:stage II sporulation protein R [Clostridia bacterium]